MRLLSIIFILLFSFNATWARLGDAQTAYQYSPQSLNSSPQYSSISFSAGDFNVSTDETWCSSEYVNDCSVRAIQLKEALEQSLAARVEAKKAMLKAQCDAARENFEKLETMDQALRTRSAVIEGLESPLEVRSTCTNFSDFNSKKILVQMKLDEIIQESTDSDGTVNISIVNIERVNALSEILEVLKLMKDTRLTECDGKREIVAKFCKAPRVVPAEAAPQMSPVESQGQGIFAMASTQASNLVEGIQEMASRDVKAEKLSEPVIGGTAVAEVEEPMEINAPEITSVPTEVNTEYNTTSDYADNVEAEISNLKNNITDFIRSAGVVSDVGNEAGGGGVVGPDCGFSGNCPEPDDESSLSNTRPRQRPTNPATDPEALAKQNDGPAYGGPGPADEGETTVTGGGPSPTTGGISPTSNGEALAKTNGGGGLNFNANAFNQGLNSMSPSSYGGGYGSVGRGGSSGSSYSSASNAYSGSSSNGGSRGYQPDAYGSNSQKVSYNSRSNNDQRNNSRLNNNNDSNGFNSYQGANSASNARGGSGANSLGSNSSNNSKSQGTRSAKNRARKKSGNKSLYSSRNEKSKGGFLSRIFGRDKDSGSKMDSSLNASNQKQKRVFDPSAYLPDEKARLRAMARATGKAIGGRRGPASANAWPSNEIPLHSEDGRSVFTKVFYSTKTYINH